MRRTNFTQKIISRKVAKSGLMTFFAKLVLNVSIYQPISNSMQSLMPYKIFPHTKCACQTLKSEGYTEIRKHKVEWCFPQYSGVFPSIVVFPVVFSRFGSRWKLVAIMEVSIVSS